MLLLPVLTFLYSVPGTELSGERPSYQQFSPPADLTVYVHASHFRSARKSDHNLPAMIKHLEIYLWCSQYLQLGTREGDRPPREGQRKVRLQQLDLDAAGLTDSILWVAGYPCM